MVGAPLLRRNGSQTSVASSVTSLSQCMQMQPPTPYAPPQHNQMPSANDTLYNGVQGGNMSFNPYSKVPAAHVTGDTLHLGGVGGGANDTKTSQNDFFQAFLEKNHDDEE